MVQKRFAEPECPACKPTGDKRQCDRSDKEQECEPQNDDVATSAAMDRTPTDTKEQPGSQEG